MEKWNIALLSFAHNHQFAWARAFKNHPRASVLCAWDDDPVRGQSGADDIGSVFEPSLENVLKNPDVQGVAICSETAKHAELVIAAAQAGKAILCEKPTALSLTDVDAMAEAIRTANVPYMQAFPQRHMPANQKIREILQSGVLGTIHSVRKRHGHGFGLQNLDDVMPWIVEPSQAGAGGFFDEGIHECDVLHWLFGQPEAVSAMVSQVTPQAKQWQMDDLGMALFRYSQGTLAVLESAWNWTAAGPTTEIYGSKGTLIQSHSDLASNVAPLVGVPTLQVFLEAEKENGWQTLSCDFNFSQAHDTVAKAFVDALVTGSPMPVTLADGRAALEMMLGAYTAARQGREVRFPLTDNDLRKLP